MSAQRKLPGKRGGKGRGKGMTDYRSIFENAVEGFYKSTPEGKFLIVNPAMTRILGYDSPEDLLGHVQDINHQYYASAERRKEFKRLLEAQGVVQNFESEVLRKDGKKIWISSNARAIKNEKGEPLYYEGFITDITDHKRAEGALLEGEKFLASIFSSIQDGISILDPDLNIVRVNDTMESWYSHASPLAGKKCYEAYRGDKKPCPVCPALEVLRTGKASYKLESKRGPDGEIIGWLDLYSFPLFDTDTGRLRGVIEYVRDISEQKIAEQALKRSEEEARKLAADKMVMAEIGRIISSTLNIEEVYDRFAEEAHKLLDFDRIAINLIDPSREVVVQAYRAGMDVAGRRPGDVFPLAGSINAQILKNRETVIVCPEKKEDLEQDYPTLITTFEAGLRSMMSVPLFSNHKIIGVLHFRSRKSGAYTENDARVAEGIAGQIAGAIANARLYAEREEAERAHRESEEKYRLLVENANDAIFIIQDGVVRFSNPKTEELLGYDARELARIPFTEHLHPLDREAIWGENGSGEGRPLSGRTFRVRSRGGQEIWVETNSVAILWEGRLATLNFARDITEQKKLEAQFLQAQKMEAVGRLAGGVAHDFNNLLTVINSNSQLALMELKEWDPLREKFESIQKAGERAANLTRQLLAFSRRQVVEMKVIDLNTLFRDLEKMLHRVIGEDIELKSALAGDLGRVKADPGQIEQAILNLVVNARDAMPSGGKLTIETGNEDVDPGFAGKHMGLKPGRYVRFSVSDTGVGMTPEVRERLFEPFFTTKEKGKGTGLGLSTVYGVVKQSGGEIWIYSEPGLGTTVRIFLPRVDEPLEKTKRKPADERMPRGRETVLVVEDEDEVRKLAVGILSRQGYRVLEASHGGDALLMMEQGREAIQLLLTDVVMPGISGPDFARRLKFVYPDLKVLYMSGYADNVIFQQGILDQGMAFLQKPFTVERLTGKVREVLDG